MNLPTERIWEALKVLKMNLQRKHQRCISRYASTPYLLCAISSCFFFKYSLACRLSDLLLFLFMFNATWVQSGDCLRGLRVMRLMKRGCEWFQYEIIERLESDLWNDWVVTENLERFRVMDSENESEGIKLWCVKSVKMWSPLQWLNII